MLLVLSWLDLIGKAKYARPPIFGYRFIYFSSSNVQSPLMYFFLNSLEVVIGREADGADTLSR